MGTFLLIMVGIFGVLLVLRLLGSLFGRSGGAGYPGQMGGMGMRPGMGPGGPGYYGGAWLRRPRRRLFLGNAGGLGGALAGNWLYDQFSGRHGGMNSADAMHSADYGAGMPDQGGDAIVGADDNPGGGNSWDDGGGRPTPAAATGAAAAVTGAAAVVTGAAVAATGAVVVAATGKLTDASKQGGLPQRLEAQKLRPVGGAILAEARPPIPPPNHVGQFR